MSVLPARPRMEPWSGSGLRLWAPAKLNLNLLVGPRREDGFHGLDSYVAKITFYDQLDLSPRQDGHLHLMCTGLSCGERQSNLALRAAHLLRDHCLGSDGPGSGHLRPGVDICLHKMIPPGKGLGGGSSDAASVLMGLVKLWRLDLDLTSLKSLGSQLGSDVPLFLDFASARMTGRGEQLEPAQVHPFVAGLCLNEYFCSTPEVYRTFDQLPRRETSQLDCSLLCNQPPSRWRHLLVNQLSDAAVSVYPQFGQLWHTLQSLLPVPVHMTGSGSALFVLCDSEGELQDILLRLPEDQRKQFLAVSNNPF